MGALLPLRFIQRFEMPVLTRELRGRMRGARAFLVMSFYLLVLSMTTLIAAVALPRTGPMMAAWRPGYYGAGTPPGPTVIDLATLGHDLFVILAIAQLALVLCISPGLTSGSISGEAEKRTLEMLALTTISTGGIIVGKLLSSLCYVGLLLFCGVPAFALTLMLGGVSPLEILFADLLALGAALLFGSLGLLASALVPRTYIATAVAGAAVLGAISLLRVVRAPQADSFEVQIRVAREVMVQREATA